jgi:hypothetical protein
MFLFNDLLKLFDLSLAFFGVISGAVINNQVIFIIDFSDCLKDLLNPFLVLLASHAMLQECIFELILILLLVFIIAANHLYFPLRFL